MHPYGSLFHPCFVNPVFVGREIPSWEKELRVFGWKGIRQKIQKSKSEKSKIYFSTFRLFRFSTPLLPSHHSAFRLFGFSSSLSTLNGLSFVLLAAHVWLKRHPAKKQNSKSGKSKSIFFDFSTLFRHIYLSIYI